MDRPDDVGILIQARMSSRRLPGKVLRLVAGRPLIAYVVERCRLAKEAGQVAIITSVEADDDALADWAAREGVQVWRGPLDDVAGRFAGAARSFGLDAFVRINADSPLVDPSLIDRAIALYRSGGADLVTNVLRRTFPVGLSVEVLDRSRFESAYAEMTRPEDLEHVTQFYYRNAARFHIMNFEANRDLGDRMLGVDTAEDLARIETIVAAMERPHIEYDCAALCAHAERLGLLARRSSA